MRVALEVGRDVGSVNLELILANGKTKKEKLHISISKIIASRGIFFTSRHLISIYFDAIAKHPYCKLNIHKKLINCYIAVS